jgi:hypothetical protein
MRPGSDPSSVAGDAVLRRNDKVLDPDAAPVVGTRFARFMQLPSRMDLSDELRRERDVEGRVAGGGPPRSVSGRNLGGRAEADGSASFASLANYAASEDMDDSRAETQGAFGDAPGRLAVDRTQSQHRLAERSIAASTSRALNKQQRAGAPQEQTQEEAEDWMASISKALRRMC